MTDSAVAAIGTLGHGPGPVGAAQLVRPGAGPPRGLHGPRGATRIP